MAIDWGRWLTCSTGRWASAQHTASSAGSGVLDMSRMRASCAMLISASRHALVRSGD